MKLVIVTGAGASHQAGPEGSPLPLMDGWADGVFEALQGVQSGMAESLGLRAGMSSTEFEDTLGAFFRWQETLPLTERFLGVGGPAPNQRPAPVNDWIVKAKSRSDDVVRVLRETLYRLFGSEAVDPERAERIWSRLLGQVVSSPQPEDTLVVATTNYDPVAEVALLRLRKDVETGRSSGGVDTPRLEPNGLVDRATSTTVPVLHLHGAVGWYRRGTRVVVYGADEAYNPTLGSPALLMPDPAKDPARDAGVQALWSEFQKALDRASHVLVAGHSLHDPVLVDYLRTADDRGTRLGIVMYRGMSPDDRASEELRIRASLPNALFISGDIGPNLQLDTDELRKWRS